MKIVIIISLTALFVIFFITLILGLLTAEKVEVIEKGKKNRLIKVIEFTEASINESNVKYYFPKYNMLLHLTLAVSLFAISFKFLGDYPVEFKILLSTIVFLIPWMILQFIKTKTTREIKKQILDLIISFKAYYILKKDVFQAFNMLEENIAEPVKSTVSFLNKQYRLKKPGEKCLETFGKRFSDLKMKMFVDQLRFALKTGGDVESICTKFINDMSKYEEIEDRDRLEGLADKYGLYLLIFLNIGVMHYMMESNYAFINFVTYNPTGKIVLAFDYLICIVLFFKLIKEG